MAEEDELLDADRLPGRPLLALSRLSHLLRSHFRIVRALLSARDHAVRHVRAGGLDPRSERARAAEIDFAGVRENRHGPPGDDETVGHYTFTLRSSSTWSQRSTMRSPTRRQAPWSA